ncbi:MAG: hypothetical protein IJX83_09015 [Lachnospiraceae bacterium]|nr:hypothetical protein [Lachnospiraceae bacterium]
MRLEEVKKIIRSEGLEDYNINLDHEIEAGEIVIVGKDGKWKVGIANDRAEIVTTSIREFNAEDEAVDDFLFRLRRLNEIKAIRLKLFGTNDAMV